MWRKLNAFCAITLVTMYINVAQSMKVYAWYRIESIHKDSRSFENRTQDKILWNDFDEYYHYKRNVYRAQKTRHGVIRQHQQGMRYSDKLWFEFQSYFIIIFNKYKFTCYNKKMYLTYLTCCTRSGWLYNDFYGHRKCLESR